VAAGVDLRGGGEDGLGELVGFAEIGRERDAADGPGGAVVLPAGAGEVAADDALDGKHLGAADDHAAAGDLLLEGRVGQDARGAERLAEDGFGEGSKERGDVSPVSGEEVVGDGVFEEVEPEGGDLGEDLPLVRDAGAEHVVEGGDAVGGDEEKVVAEGVEVADLAAGEQGKAAKVGGKKRFGHFVPREDGNIPLSIPLPILIFQPREAQISITGRCGIEVRGEGSGQGGDGWFGGFDVGGRLSSREGAGGNGADGGADDGYRAG
jgi:hypothetical protein